MEATQVENQERQPEAREKKKLALKLPKKELDGVLRISFSYDTTPQDIDALLEGLKAAQEQLFTSLS